PGGVSRLFYPPSPPFALPHTWLLPCCQMLDRSSRGLPLHLSELILRPFSSMPTAATKGYFVSHLGRFLPKHSKAIPKWIEVRSRYLRSWLSRNRLSEGSPSK